MLYGGSSTGGWDEPAQVDALTDETDVVTITIGGNDAGFQEYLEGCVINPCGPLTITYGAVMALIDSSSFQSNLETTYEKILDEAPSADVYVLDYPYLSPEEILYCGVVDLSGGRSIQFALNTVIAEAVANVKEESIDYDNRLNYVPTNEEGGPFEETYLCNGDPDNLALGLVTFHPNVTGHTHYKEVLTAYMTE